MLERDGRPKKPLEKANSYQSKIRTASTNTKKIQTEIMKKRLKKVLLVLFLISSVSTLEGRPWTHKNGRTELRDRSAEAMMPRIVSPCAGGLRPVLPTSAAVREPQGGKFPRSNFQISSNIQIPKTKLRVSDEGLSRMVLSKADFRSSFVGSFIASFVENRLQGTGRTNKAYDKARDEVLRDSA